MTIQVPTSRRSTRSKTRHTILTERISGNENGSAIAIKAEMPKLGWSNGKELLVAPEQRSQWMYRSIEENLLTLLEHSENADPEEVLVDKIMFVEATNALCVVPNSAQVPTQKMLQAVLEFIQECSSVGLTASSFNLLADLEKHHPRELVSPDRQLVPSSSTRVSANIFILLEEIARRVQQEGGVDSGGKEELYNELEVHHVSRYSGKMTVCLKMVGELGESVRRGYDVFEKRVRFKMEPVKLRILWRKTVKEEKFASSDKRVWAVGIDILVLIVKVDTLN
ncbi:hypothetical protein R1flu_028648 [Riccia fluitans]|uniref:Uncharacterized protein n=1 Tax=Riccia fluitans TaxID=41844 RepID=A0ABD1XMV5_9MARC